MSFNYKIYSLTNSDNLRDVRYIGKTKLDLDKRLYFHIKSINYEKTYKANWIKSVLNSGNKIVIKEILSGLDEAESTRQEIKFIKEFKEKGFKLTNGTNGGDGLSNPTQETIEKIRKSCKKSYENGRVQSNNGKTFEEIHGNEKAGLLKEQFHKEQLGKKIPEKQREKSKANHAKYWFGKNLSQEHAEKLQNARLCFIKNNPDFYKNKGAKMKKQIVQMDLNENEIKVWNSIKEAGESLKIIKSGIGECCRGRRKTASNFKWKFLNK